MNSGPEILAPSGLWAGAGRMAVCRVSGEMKRGTRERPAMCGMWRRIGASRCARLPQRGAASGDGDEQLGEPVRIRKVGIVAG
jgi:hypothetical protein